MKNFIFIILYFFISFFIIAENKMKVVFLNPGRPDELFWNAFVNQMQTASDQLDIDLKIFYANRNRAKILEQAKIYLTGNNRPDFIVFQNMKDTAPELLKMAEENKVKSFVVNSTLTEEDFEIYGHPREKFKYWIGQMTPDDFGAGYNLVKELVNKCRRIKKTGEKIGILAIGGTVSDTSAIERNNGFLKFIKEDKNVFLYRDHILPGNWNQDEAKQIFSNAYNIYPELSVVWCANDAMGLGVLDSVKNNFKKQPGIDILIGGVGCTDETNRAIKNREISVVIGGHYMEGAWIIILLYDYYNGIDFKNEGSVSIKSKMAFIDYSNINSYLNFLNNKIDFKKFSKKINPGIKKYDFDFEKIINQF